MKIELPEIVAIGIFNTKAMASFDNTIESKPRKIKMFEIEIPIEEGGISYIQDEKSAITPDMVICAKPGQTRHTKLPYKCFYVHMIAGDGDLKDNLMSLPNFIKTNKYDKYYEIFQKMCKYYETGLESDEIILHSLILELVFLLLREATKTKLMKSMNSANVMAIERVIKYIKENLTEDLSLEKLSALAGFSPIYFHNSFKSATGMTVREYVEEQRIKKAVNILVTTDKTLTSVAYECGFSSQSYFSYAFKRKMKLTPREYVKQVFSRYQAE